jgi:hypothetical protein
MAMGHPRTSEYARKPAAKAGVVEHLVLWATLLALSLAIGAAAPRTAPAADRHAVTGV